METFLAALAGALAGSFVSAAATWITLQRERSTTFEALVARDTLDACALIESTFHDWFRSVLHLFGPLGDPGSDERQEAEMMRRGRLVSIRHRLPPGTDAGGSIDALIEDYDAWVGSWLLEPSVSKADLALPEHLIDQAAAIKLSLPGEMRDVRALLRRPERKV